MANLFTTFLDAARIGITAKAQKDAAAAANRRAARGQGECTPCAANARVQALREQAAKNSTATRGRR